MKALNLKKDFPVFNEGPLVYLDTAASSLTPKSVIDAMDAYYKTMPVNVHRGVYQMSYEATRKYEAARENIASFINADFEEIFFTRGASSALNMLARMYEPFIDENDEIIISEIEHHSHLLPWQQVAKRTGAKLVYVPLEKNGRITPQLYNKFLSCCVFCSKFCGLPKLHKQGIPLRPILASTKSPASNIGKWLCTALKPLLHSQKSYIKNSVNLVEKLKQIDISENSILSSFDIVSMYTGIYVSNSEQLLQNKLENNYHLIEESAIGLDIDVLMHLVKLCNKYSMHFQFQDSYYKQVKGLPMGAPLSGLLANIFVENREN